MYVWTIPSYTVMTSMDLFSSFRLCESFSAAPCFINLHSQEIKVEKIFY